MDTFGTFQAQRRRDQENKLGNIRALGSRCRSKATKGSDFEANKCSRCLLLLSLDLKQLKKRGLRIWVLAGSQEKAGSMPRRMRVSPRFEVVHPSCMLTSRAPVVPIALHFDCHPSVAVSSRMSSRAWSVSRAETYSGHDLDGKSALRCGFVL